jgi:phospho-N-acetylmuramoyl-pentapeptide-transferase
MQIFEITRVLLLTTLAFTAAIVLTPILTRFLYKHKAWKKQVRQYDPSGAPAIIFSKLHKDKEVGTPRMGGLLIWVVTLILAVVFYALSSIFNGIWNDINFLSRAQTWLPLFTLVAAGVIGLSDDLFVINNRGGYAGGGIRFRHRLFLVFLIALIGAWWFYFKLDFDVLNIPFIGNIVIGPLYVLFFILVMLATFSSGVVDGLDGLSGGVFASIFGAYGVIAFARGQYDLAVLLGVIVGALLAFLWFNIPPARFYMGETGILALTTTLTVVAFLTNSVLLLPVIGLILVIESLSVVIQLTSKKFFKRKIFLVAPLHHHFEAEGWPAYKVTMRFWVISFVFAALGLVIFLLDQQINF